MKLKKREERLAKSKDRFEEYKRNLEKEGKMIPEDSKKLYK